MFTLDIPYVPTQETRTVLAQAAVPQANATRPDFLLKLCVEVPTAGGSLTAMNAVDPAGMLAAQLGNRTNRYIDSATETTININLMEGTKRGKLNPKTSGSGKVYYVYESNPGYLGRDKAVFMADFEGKRYQVVVNIVVSAQVIENPPTSAMTPVCPNPTLIRVKHNAQSGAPTAGAMLGLTRR